ncbi:MAG: hypothetical protein JSV65_15030 [Armatimonadota bacterium]|nr:MAG: hypothetical protein JSV65_15030 [Armatimonadota bacterium]
MTDKRLSALALLLWCAALPATAPDSPAAAGDQSDWSASLTVFSQRVLPAEPVLVTLRLTYRGDEPFTGYASFGRFEVQYWSPAGGKRIHSFSSPPFQASTDELPPVRARTYAAGYVGEVSVLVLYDPDRGACFFQEPGVGCFMANGEVWEGAVLEEYRPVRVDSAPVAVEVLPMPTEEIDAFALWRGEDKALMFLAGIGDEGTRADLQALADRYPQSAYAKYALLALAQGKHRQWKRLHGSGPDFARLVSDELDLLHQVAERHPSFHLMPTVADRILDAALWMPGWPHTEKYAKMLLEMPNAPQEYRTHARQALEGLKAQQ